MLKDEQINGQIFIEKFNKFEDFVVIEEENIGNKISGMLCFAFRF